MERKWWLGFSCSTALLLILSSQAKKAVEDLGGLRDSAQMPGDFAVYYVAGKMARHAGDRRLHYPPLNEAERLNFVDMLRSREIGTL